MFRFRLRRNRCLRLNRLYEIICRFVYLKVNFFTRDFLSFIDNRMFGDSLARHWYRNRLGFFFILILFIILFH